MMTKLTLSTNEQRIMTFLGNCESWEEITTVTRDDSGEEFDIHFTGVSRLGSTTCNASADMKLALIHESIWCAPSIAILSSYPQMASSGDWSGIRDSDPEAIDAMFWKALGFLMPTWFKGE